MLSIPEWKGMLILTLEIFQLSFNFSHIVRNFEIFSYEWAQTNETLDMKAMTYRVGNFWFIWKVQWAFTGFYQFQKKRDTFLRVIMHNIFQTWSGNEEDAQEHEACRLHYLQEVSRETLLNGKGGRTSSSPAPVKQSHALSTWPQIFILLSQYPSNIFWSISIALRRWVSRKYKCHVCIYLERWNDLLAAGSDIPSKR